MEKNMDRDLMLMAILAKGLEIINVEPNTQYDGLKKTLESELKTIQTRVSSKLPPINKPKTKTPSMTDDDKKFVIDTLLDVIGSNIGNIGKTETWEKSSSASKFTSQFLGDFMSSVYKSDWDSFEKKEKEKAHERFIEKKTKDKWISYDDIPDWGDDL